MDEEDLDAVDISSNLLRLLPTHPKIDITKKRNNIYKLFFQSKYREKWKALISKKLAKMHIQLLRKECNLLNKEDDLKFQKRNKLFFKWKQICKWKIYAKEILKRLHKSQLDYVRNHLPILGWKLLAAEAKKQIHENNFIGALDTNYRENTINHFFSFWKNRAITSISIRNHQLDNWYFFSDSLLVLQARERLDKARCWNIANKNWQRIAYSAYVRGKIMNIHKAKHMFDKSLQLTGFVGAYISYLTLKKCRKEAGRLQRRNIWRSFAIDTINNKMLDDVAVARNNLDSALKIYILIEKIVHKSKIDNLKQARIQLNEEIRLATLRQYLSIWSQKTEAKSYAWRFIKSHLKGILRDYSHHVQNRAALKIQQCFLAHLHRQAQAKLLKTQILLEWRKLPKYLTERTIEFPELELQLNNKVSFDINFAFQKPEIDFDIFRDQIEFAYEKNNIFADEVGMEAGLLFDLFIPDLSKSSMDKLENLPKFEKPFHYTEYDVNFSFDFVDIKNIVSPLAFRPKRGHLPINKKLINSCVPSRLDLDLRLGFDTKKVSLKSLNSLNIRKQKRFLNFDYWDLLPECFLENVLDSYIDQTIKPLLTADYSVIHKFTDDEISEFRESFYNSVTNVVIRAFTPRFDLLEIDAKELPEENIIRPSLGFDPDMFNYGFNKTLHWCIEPQVLVPLKSMVSFTPSIEVNLKGERKTIRFEFPIYYDGCPNYITENNKHFPSVELEKDTLSAEFDQFIKSVSLSVFDSTAKNILKDYEIEEKVKEDYEGDFNTQLLEEEEDKFEEEKEEEPIKNSISFINSSIPSSPKERFIEDLIRSSPHPKIRKVPRINLSDSSLERVEFMTSSSYSTISSPSNSPQKSSREDISPVSLAFDNPSKECEISFDFETSEISTTEVGFNFGRSGEEEESSELRNPDPELNGISAISDTENISSTPSNVEDDSFILKLSFSGISGVNIPAGESTAVNFDFEDTQQTLNISSSVQYQAEININRSRPPKEIGGILNISVSDFEEEEIKETSNSSIVCITVDNTIEYTKYNNSPPYMEKKKKEKQEVTIQSPECFEIPGSSTTSTFSSSAAQQVPVAISSPAAFNIPQAPKHQRQRISRNKIVLEKQQELNITDSSFSENQTMGIEEKFQVLIGNPVAFEEIGYSSPMGTPKSKRQRTSSKKSSYSISSIDEISESAISYNSLIPYGNDSTNNSGYQTDHNSEEDIDEYQTFTESMIINQQNSQTSQSYSSVNEEEDSDSFNEEEETEDDIEIESTESIESIESDTEMSQTVSYETIVSAMPNRGSFTGTIHQARPSNHLVIPNKQTTIFRPPTIREISFDEDAGVKIPAVPHFVTKKPKVSTIEGLPVVQPVEDPLMKEVPKLELNQEISLPPISVSITMPNAETDTLPIPNMNFDAQNVTPQINDTIQINHTPSIMDNESKPNTPSPSALPPVPISVAKQDPENVLEMSGSKLEINRPPPIGSPKEDKDRADLPPAPPFFIESPKKKESDSGFQEARFDNVPPPPPLSGFAFNVLSPERDRTDTPTPAVSEFTNSLLPSPTIAGPRYDLNLISVIIAGTLSEVTHRAAEEIVAQHLPMFEIPRQAPSSPSKYSIKKPSPRKGTFAVDAKKLFDNSFFEAPLKKTAARICLQSLPNILLVRTEDDANTTELEMDPRETGSLSGIAPATTSSIPDSFDLSAVDPEAARDRYGVSPRIGEMLDFALSREVHNIIGQ